MSNTKPHKLTVTHLYNIYYSEEIIKNSIGGICTKLITFQISRLNFKRNFYFNKVHYVPLASLNRFRKYKYRPLLYKPTGLGMMSDGKNTQ